MIFLAPLFFGLVHQTGLHLPALFSDEMVLQCDFKAPIYGTAKPGDTVTVDIAGQRLTTKAGKDGAWSVNIRPLKAGGPYTLTVAADVSLTYRDVLAGEVWVCSGQSNMEFPMSGVIDAKNEIANSADPMIRLMTVPKLSVDTPVKDFQGSWKQCGPDTVGGFSAVAYFFARELRKRLGVPVGLIHSSWGGTPAESWTRRDVLKSDPKIAILATRYEEMMKNYPQAKADYDKAFAEWQKKALAQDDGNVGFGLGWASDSVKAEDWQEATVPEAVEDLMHRTVLGSFWYRRTVEVPASWAGKDIELDLGGIDDYDTTYFNNQQVGSTGRETPSSWSVPRRYKVPGSLVKAGTNVVAIRAFNEIGSGGPNGSADLYALTNGTESVPLAGKWEFRIEKEAAHSTIDAQNNMPQPPLGPGNPWVPGSLYNGMIAPLIPYGIRGAIWYQGESNADRAYQYRRLFPTMIQNWRKDWGQGDFPFYFVQLANFMPLAVEPVSDPWAELREAQTMTLSLPNTGMATIIDIGMATDIHPKDKQDVGYRLALNALDKTYGRHLEFSGPMKKSASFAAQSARIEFDHTKGGLVAKGGPLVGFAICGSDHKFVWADAKIVGNTVVVTSSKIDKAVAVRYAWSSNPPCNLFNGEGLPAVPFRTDDWPCVTLLNK